MKEITLESNGDPSTVLSLSVNENVVHVTVENDDPLGFPITAIIDRDVLIAAVAR